MNTDRLTNRENEILIHLARGSRVKIIARALSISTCTVRAHLRSVFTKLEVHSQAELIERLPANNEYTIRHDLEGGRRDLNSIKREFTEANQRAMEAITDMLRQVYSDHDQVIDQKSGVAAAVVNDLIVRVLPIAGQMREDWEMRFNGIGTWGQSKEFRSFREAEIESLLQFGIGIVEDLQAKGYMRKDLNSREVAETLRDQVGSVAALLIADADPCTQQRQLGLIQMTVAYLLQPPTR